LIRLAVRVDRSRAELVLAELLALSPGGMEERDVDADTVEYAIYGAPGELPLLGEVEARAGDALVAVSTSEVADDWADRWRRWHRPVEVAGLHVRPPWSPPAPSGPEIVVDPGRAFGTGAHPSTRLALELLASVQERGGLADWGCGSGVLAVAGAKLGFAPVHACDLDTVALEVTRSTAEANGVALGSVTRVDLRREPGPWAPTVVANLVRPLLLELAAVLGRPPERLIASGLLPGDVGEVEAAFAPHGLVAAGRRDGDGWSAILLAA
jgi:ribosomal protein L11 methyltransferase